MVRLMVNHKTKNKIKNCWRHETPLPFLGMEKGFHRTQNENEHLHCINACSSSKINFLLFVISAWEIHETNSWYREWETKQQGATDREKEKKDRKIKLRNSNGTIQVPLIFCNNFHIQFWETCSFSLFYLSIIASGQCNTMKRKKQQIK